VPGIPLRFLFCFALFFCADSSNQKSQYKAVTELPLAESLKFEW